MKAGIRLMSGWRLNLALWALLALPVGVFFLPAFQTTFLEDLLILAVSFYLFLRAANSERIPIPAGFQPVLTAILLGVFFAVGWFGVLRGYEDFIGRWLVLYPAPILLTLFFPPNPSQPLSRGYRILAVLFLVVSITIFSLVGIFAYLFSLETVKNSLHIKGSVIPTLLVIPILGGAVLAARRTPPLSRGIDHLPLLTIALVAALCVWSGNIKTWTIWYQAGLLERAWTPFKNEQPDYVAQAERKPYEAAAAYNQVRERILQKGEIPQYLNWPFFMQYRMAFQYMRKQDPIHCAYALPPASPMPPSHIELVKALWGQEFIWTIPKNEPDYPRNGSIWVDGEIDKNQKYYLLDCWGRVYANRDGLLWLEWKPDSTFNDAVALELLGETFVILRRNGVVLTSKPVSMFQKNAVFPPGCEQAVDLEIAPNCLTAFAANEYGDIFFWGEYPSLYPPFDRLRVNFPVYVDLELELAGDGYYLLDKSGAIHANRANGTPSIPCTSPPVPKELIPYWSNQSMAVDLKLDKKGRGLYVYNRLGEIYTIAVKPYRETYRPAKTYPHRGVALLDDAQGNLFALESNGAVIKIP